MRKRLLLLGIAFVASCGARTGLDVALDHFDATPLIEDGSPDLAVEAGVLGCASPHVIFSQAFDHTDLTQQVDQIVAAHGEVYIHAGAIWHISTATGTVEELGAYGPQTWPVLAKLDINDDQIFWAIPGSFASTVFSAPLDGGPTHVLATVLSPLSDFVSVTNGGLYVFTEALGPEQIAFVAFDGGVTHSATLLPYTQSRLLVVGDTIYVGSLGGLFSWDGSAVMTLLTSIPVADLALDGDSVVFTESWQGATDDHPLSVWRESLVGGTPAAIVSEVSPLLGGIAVDDTSIYFCDRGGDRGTAELVRITKLTGVTTTIAHSDDQIMDVALDDKCVYWTSAAGGNPASPGNQVFAAPK